MSITVEELRGLLEPQVPIERWRFSLRLGERSGASVFEDDRGQLRVVIQLWVWEEAGGSRQIRDIKEQEVVFVTAAQRGDPRLAAYVEGWANAVGFVFEQAPVGSALECAMPYDLVSCEVLKLKRPKKADDFEAALLGAKRRLGRFLPR